MLNANAFTNKALHISKQIDNIALSTLTAGSIDSSKTRQFLADIDTKISQYCRYR